VSYQFFDIDDAEYIIIFILRDTAQGIGAPYTALFDLYVQFRYPRYCSDVDGCKKLFQQRIKSTIELPEIRDIVVPYTDGEILRFRGILRYLTVSYQGGEYQSDGHFLGKD
jgi:hypothetical protein